MSTNCINCVKNKRTGPDLLCDECRKPSVRCDGSLHCSRPAVVNVATFNFCEVHKPDATREPAQTEGENPDTAKVLRDVSVGLVPGTSISAAMMAALDRNSEKAKEQINELPESAKRSIEAATKRVSGYTLEQRKALEPSPVGQTPDGEALKPEDYFCQWCYDQGLRYPDDGRPWAHAVDCPHRQNRRSTPAREALKPCPLCGGPAAFGEVPDGENFGGQYIACESAQCGCSTLLMFPAMEGVKDQLREIWNRRATTPREASPKGGQKS